MFYSCVSFVVAVICARLQTEMMHFTIERFLLLLNADNIDNADPVDLFYAYLAGCSPPGMISSFCSPPETVLSLHIRE